MKSAKARATLQKERCPACTREFTVGLISARNGIRCPHCRAAVTVTPRESELFGRAVPSEAPTAAADATECLKQCEALRLRIDSLERVVESQLRSIHAEASCTPGDTLTSHAAPTALPRVPSEANLQTNGKDAQTNEKPPAENAPTAKCVPLGEVHLVAAVHDSSTRERIDAVEKLLVAAGWRTRERTTHHVPCTVPLGFTLSISSAVSGDRLKSIFNAFCKARLPLKLQLDPRPRDEEAILFIGAAVAND